MKIKNIRNQIKKAAKDFGLKYNLKWFNYMWITKRDEIDMVERFTLRKVY